VRSSIGNWLKTPSIESKISSLHTLASGIRRTRWAAFRNGHTTPICRPGETVDITVSFVAPLEAATTRVHGAWPTQPKICSVIQSGRNFRSRLLCPWPRRHNRREQRRYLACRQVQCRPQSRRCWPWLWVSSTRRTRCACWPPQPSRTHSKPCRLQRTMR